MIKRMLDTNICIYIAKKQPPEVIQKFAEYRRGEIAISSVTWGELCCGTSKQGETALRKLLQFWEVIPFDRNAAEIYALLTIENPNRKAGFDRLIAAHAISINVPLVTNNISDFKVYKKCGLQLENWLNEI